MNFDPPWTSAEDLPTVLARQGFAAVTADCLAGLAGVELAGLRSLTPAWNRLQPDRYLRDGGRYRSRRHSSFVAEAGHVTPVPHRAHWQSLNYNALHGGIERWFEPLDAAWLADSAFMGLLGGCAQLAEGLKPGTGRWFIEAHAFRIDCTEGIGRPTPEGAHRDGVDLVAVVLVNRHAVSGGETRVFDAQGPNGMRFTLREAFSALFLDDERVIHESTPIQPERSEHGGASDTAGAWRDTLVITCRRGGFQDPPPPL